jgi:DNA mismatch endonuclease (patch repair protein)
MLAVFVHGCFWHRHADCYYATTPKTRQTFWEEKFMANVKRDRQACLELEHLGWKVLVVWECGFKHSSASMSNIPSLIKAVNQYQEWPDMPPRRRLAVF